MNFSPRQFKPRARWFTWLHLWLLEAPALSTSRSTGGDNKRTGRGMRRKRRGKHPEAGQCRGDRSKAEGRSTLQGWIRAVSVRHARRVTGSASVRSLYPLDQEVKAVVHQEKREPGGFARPRDPACSRLHSVGPQDVRRNVLSIVIAFREFPPWNPTARVRDRDEGGAVSREAAIYMASR